MKNSLITLLVSIFVIATSAFGQVELDYDYRIPVIEANQVVSPSAAVVAEQDRVFLNNQDLDIAAFIPEFEHDGTPIGILITSTLYNTSWEGSWLYTGAAADMNFSMTRQFSHRNYCVNYNWFYKPTWTGSCQFPGLTSASGTLRQSGFGPVTNVATIHDLWLQEGSDADYTVGNTLGDVTVNDWGSHAFPVPGLEQEWYMYRASFIPGDILNLDSTDWPIERSFAPNFYPWEYDGTESFQIWPSQRTAWYFRDDVPAGQQFTHFSKFSVGINPNTYRWSVPRVNDSVAFTPLDVEVTASYRIEFAWIYEPAVPGDMNDDGIVDFNDVLEVISKYGSLYDFDHLLNVLTNYGA